MNRIRRLSRLMAAACLAVSWLLAAAMLFYWVTAPSQLVYAHAGLSAGLSDRPAGALEIGFIVRALAFGICMVPLGALIAGLFSARHCFSAFAGGRIFHPEPITRLKGFAIGLAASALLKPVSGAALSFLLSYTASAGPVSLVFNLGSEMVIALIFAGTLAAIAWVMSEALSIADENRQFV